MVATSYYYNGPSKLKFVGLKNYNRIYPLSVEIGSTNTNSKSYQAKHMLKVSKILEPPSRTSLSPLVFLTFNKDFPAD